MLRGEHRLVEPTNDTVKKAAALAQRLRMVYTDLADQQSDLREGQLYDEIQRVLGSTPPQDREGLLRQLMQEFPASSDGESAAPAPARESRDPRALAERLAKLAMDLPDAEKAALAAILKQAGIVETVKQVVRETVSLPPSTGTMAPTSAGTSAGTLSGTSAGSAAFTGEGLTDLCRALAIPTAQGVNPQRAAELAALLAEFAVRIEPWACQYWRDLAPDAKNLIAPTLGKDMARYASGDDKLSRDVIADDLYNLRSVVSLLMKGVVEAGRQFGRDHVTRFSVDSVLEEAKRVKTFTQSVEAAAWAVYVRRMQGVDAADMEKRLRQLIAADVDAALGQVMRKRKAPR